LRDGDRVAPRETVMLIRGPYVAFAHLETLYLGRWPGGRESPRTRGSWWRPAWPKPVMFFPARFDHWLVQTGDGYAAHIAGAIGVSTDAQASWWGSTGIGTVPHALIAAFGGDTVAASVAMAGQTGPDVQMITLVDFDNDCVGTSLAVARALGPALHGVRLDTSETMVDRSIVPQMGDFDPRGVNPQLVRNVRAALDAKASITSHHGVGRFDPAKIRASRATGPGRLLRRRLVALRGALRFHRRHRRDRRSSGGEAGEALPAEPEARGSGVIPDPTRPQEVRTALHRVDDVPNLEGGT
jgi:nicotinate phosphoribosyltransferase